MNFKTTLSKLYFLLVHADGVVNEREVAIAAQMIKSEGIEEKDFSVWMESFKKRNPATLYAESLEELKKMDHQKQVRCVAWLCVVANADGFMDKDEWRFIYKIYCTELGLNLDDIMRTQKELITLSREKSLHYLAVL